METDKGVLFKSNQLHASGAGLLVCSCKAYYQIVYKSLACADVFIPQQVPHSVRTGAPSFCYSLSCARVKDVSKPHQVCIV